MSVILFELDKDNSVVVHSDDHENVREYFMQTTEVIKSESISDVLRRHLLRHAGIMEE